MQITEEIWGNAIGYEGLYEVSDTGRVKNSKTSHILTPAVSRGGYFKVNLYKDSLRKTHLVHRLIGIAFIQNPENKEEINHKNGIKADNRALNLEWVTPSENMTHAYENGLKFVGEGEEHHNSKLTNEKVLAIRELAKDRKGYKKIGKMFNVSSTTIGIIIRRKVWRHI